MMIPTWLRSAAGSLGLPTTSSRRSRRGAARSRPRRPALLAERLEDRTVLDAATPVAASVLAYWTPGAGGVGTLEVKGSWTWPDAKLNSGYIVGDAVFIEGATGTQFFPNEKTFTNDLGDPNQSAPNDGMHVEQALTSGGITARTGTFDVKYTNVPSSLFSSYGPAPRVLLVLYDVRTDHPKMGDHSLLSSGSGHNSDNSYKANTYRTVITAFLPPTSTCSAPSFSYGPAWNVSYTADDTGGPGLNEVDLYAKGPSDSSYTKVASTTTNLASGSFSYPATEGNGIYNFYTVAIDTNSVAGNVSATASTHLFPLPTSTFSAPATSSLPTWDVSYTADDTGGPGLNEVDLYAKGPSDSSYSKVASTTTNLDSGSLSYTATEGNGTYSFYTVAVDIKNVAGNPSATAVTQFTLALPTSTCSAPATSSLPTWDVSYTAADTGGPGLGQVNLYAKGPTDTNFTFVFGNAVDLATGSFSYTATEGNGTYSFYTVAVDIKNVAGNPSATAATQFTLALPTSTCSAPATSSLPTWNVSYTADDTGGPGLGQVNLYAKGPADTNFTFVIGTAINLASGSLSYTATEGNGTYSFYTVAYDTNGVAGNPSATAVTQFTLALLTFTRSAPATSPLPTWDVSYTADDTGGPGLGSVSLYAKGSTDTNFTFMIGTLINLASGSFSYTATEGNGTYSFYTVAGDTNGVSRNPRATAVTQLMS
jgi:hypothetical protein